MESVHELWRSYHAAVQSGKIDLAKRILHTINTRKVEAPRSIYPKKTRGCVKCQRRFM